MRGKGLGFIAPLLVLMVVAIGWSVVQFRQTIAQLWPQSASLYAAIGLPVNLRGIALTDVSYKQEFEDGQPVLSVTGKVVNISDREQPVPEIRVVITDDARRELYHWTFDAGVPTLKPHAQSSFVTRPFRACVSRESCNVATPSRRVMPEYFQVELAVSPCGGCFSPLTASLLPPKGRQKKSPRNGTSTGTG